MPELIKGDIVENSAGSWPGIGDALPILLEAHQRVIDNAISGTADHLVVHLPGEAEPRPPIAPVGARSPSFSIRRKLNKISVRNARQGAAARDTRWDYSRLAAWRRELIRADPPVAVDVRAADDRSGFRVEGPAMLKTKAIIQC